MEEIGEEAEVGDVSMPDADTKTDGVACKRRQSFDLRFNNDKPSPLVKVCANCEPARRGHEDVTRVLASPRSRNIFY